VCDSPSNEAPHLARYIPAAVSYFAIKNDNTISRRKEILPAGWGMKDVQLLILTPNGSVAGIGELGEIYVRRCVCARACGCVWVWGGGGWVFHAIHDLDMSVLRCRPTSGLLSPIVKTV
jgi:hypothetical protein